MGEINNTEKVSASEQALLKLMYLVTGYGWIMIAFHIAFGGYSTHNGSARMLGCGAFV
jgi:hypothetical protein